MKPGAILFDLDDTITRFSAQPRDFWHEALEAHRAELDAPARAALRGAIDRCWTAFWSTPGHDRRGRLDLIWARREIVRAAAVTMAGVSEGLADRIADHFTYAKEDAIAPFEGALETLTELKARGIPLALVTNGGSTFQRRKLTRYDLEPFFETIVIEGELGTGKPDPANFRAALAGVGVAPEAAWMVGDNLQADIAGAQALGIVGIWHDCRGVGLPPGTTVTPDRTVGAIRELLAWL